jgi:glucose/arabinose dehydrogenase
MKPPAFSSALACGVLAIAACGSSSKKNPAKDDAAPMTIDAAPLIPCTPVSGTTVKARKLPDKVVGGAMLATSPPNDGRLFVLEQRGAIRIYENEQLKQAPFLDLSVDNSGPVLAGGEQGLLGLAFHPQYAQNGQFFVFYTANNPVKGGDAYVDVLARYTVSATDPNKADPTGTIVLSIPDFASNHNGGMMEFGADGYLYIGTGDGGNAGDPRHNGQDSTKLLAKILRLDVDHKAAGKEYGIPSDNPFGNEVFILGVRNPWRWSFDRMTGDLWIGDVGQDQTEELDVLLAGDQKGKNLGWSLYEGPNCCTAATNKCQQGTPLTCDPAGKTFALDYRDHNTGWLAIIGGQVYRGSCYPDLVGWYFYTDNNHGGMTKARLKADKTLEIVDLPGTFPSSPASIHADARGELYETDTAGNVYHIEASP